MLIPGDPSGNRAERIAEGVPIDDETWREITLAARGINVLIEPPKGNPRKIAAPHSSTGAGGFRWTGGDVRWGPDCLALAWATTSP